jgi:hypothetical protein
MKIYYFKKKIILFILSIICLILSFLALYKIEENLEYKQDDLTIVSCYYKVKSKHKPREYLDWINNLVKLNKSIVFFGNEKSIRLLKRMRPKKFHYKTIFNTLEISEFYSYKNFIKEFTASWKIDFEKSYQTIPLYLIWAEKCNFLKKTIEKNYFNSTCFYWVDIGYFREKNEMNKYSENWPSTKKCYEDPRLLLGRVRNISNSEKEKILKFDIDSHIYLQKNVRNVASGVFGGQANNIIKFVNLYYNSLRLFIKYKLFIGKEQNVFTYIALSNPKIVKLTFCKTFFDFKIYLS